MRVQLPKTSYATDFCKLVLLSYLVLFFIVVEAVIVHYVASLVRRVKLSACAPCLHLNQGLTAGWTGTFVCHSTHKQY